MVPVVKVRATIEGAIDLAGFEGVEIWGIDVGVVERVGRCCAPVTSISFGRVDVLVGM